MRFNGNTACGWTVPYIPKLKLEVRFATRCYLGSLILLGMQRHLHSALVMSALQVTLRSLGMTKAETLT